MLKDVLIIGAGPAGLSTAYYLQQAGVDFVILEKGDSPGFSYSKMHESLKLLTPAVYSHLPGKKLSKDFFTYYSRQQLLDYYQSYAKHFSFPLKLNTEVISVAFKEGVYHVKTSGGEFVAGAVIAASGVFSHPVEPVLEGKASIPVMHSSAYFNSDSLGIGEGKGRVLVVGGGNTGTEIALDLADEGFEVGVSTRRGLRVWPHQIVGLDVHFLTRPFEYLSRLICRMTKKPFALKKTPVLGRRILSYVRSKKIELFPRLVGVEGDVAGFGSGEKREFDAVILATGYAFKTPFFKDVPEEAEGGLFYVGKPGQMGLDSAFLRGVALDAKQVVGKVEEFLK